MAPLVLALYRRHAVGCCLHIVLDDGNVHDGHVNFCHGLALEKKHADCLELATLLQQMSRRQRRKLFEMDHEVFA